MGLKGQNRLVILTAIICVIIQIVLLKEVFQLVFANIVGVGNSMFTFSFPSFSYYFEPEPNTSKLLLLFLYFTPYLYIVSAIEISSILMRKTPLGKLRYFLVVFILLQLGYILVNLFYNAVILILNPGIENDWIALSLNMGFSETERFVFAFGIIFLFVFYMNISTKRIIKYIKF